MSREEVRGEWKGRVEEFRKSGQTAVEWCRVHDLNVTQFRRWIHKFPVEDEAEKDPSTIRWLSVRTEGSTTYGSSASTVTIRIGAVGIEVRDGFNPALLKQVVQALAE